MTDTTAAHAQAPAEQRYDAEYYHSHCGSVPYTADSEHWQAFYGSLADKIVLSLQPARVFDAGCALGFLVAAFWDRNVEAFGRDVSEFAISQARPDIRKYCSVGSITDPIDGPYDLVTCIEVLEHIPEEEALDALKNLVTATDRILFSSTPSDLDEPTHVNVRPIAYWLNKFAEAGFAPVVGHDASYVAPHAILFQRSEEGRSPRDLSAFAEIVRQRLARAAEASRTAEVAAELTKMHALLASEQEAWRQLQAEWRDRFDQQQSELDEARAAASRRATELERAALALLSLQHVGRRASRVAWWTVTMQLPQRLAERRQRRALDTAQVPPAPGTPSPDVPVPASIALRDRFAALAPLQLYPAPEGVPHVTLVTDSVGPGSLFGGVGTALIFATLLAERLGGRVRIVTRTEPPDLSRVGGLLRAHGVAWDEDIVGLHAPPGGDVQVPLGDADVFLTTSWWTTRAALPVVPGRQLLYLLQEDERMFYPNGDDRLLCDDTLRREDLRLIINSGLLAQHLTQGSEALPALTERSVTFEPAFPEELFHRQQRVASQKRNLLFYARPNNLRNLYWLGLTTLDTAFARGILDPDMWHCVFVGRDLRPVVLAGGEEPELLENLGWAEYAARVRSCDLGLALMDTPHASYPPLDLAASGAVVVTNTHGVKTSLETYSANILAVPPSVEHLCSALQEAVALVADSATRERNWASSHLQRDWRTTFEPVLRTCSRWLTS
ncbi:MAG: rhamnosyltransferase WsaF family glycosyltransferase [Candidatus Dormibacteria bacterium]